VNLTGGRTKDGGNIVGASVFYSDPPDVAQEPRKDTKDEVERLNQELKVSRSWSNLTSTEKYKSDYGAVFQKTNNSLPSKLRMYH